MVNLAGNRPSGGIREVGVVEYFCGVPDNGGRRVPTVVVSFMMMRSQWKGNTQERERRLFEITKGVDSRVESAGYVEGAGELLQLH